METKFKSFVRILLPALLLCSLLVQPAAAQAFLEITGVTPSTVTNNMSVELVVTGSGFADGSRVVLENYGGLNTTFVSANMLTATLPAGLPTGKYTITVINPDSTWVALAGALTITQATPTPGGSSGLRPVLVLHSYNPGVDSVSPGQEIDLVIKIENAGAAFAFNILVNFNQGDFVARKTGGVQAIPELDPGETQRLSQPLTANRDILGKSFAALTMVVTYTDQAGTAYTETFNVTIPVTQGKGGPLPTATPTPTPTAVPVLRPQVVITGYSTNMEILQPGHQFDLDLQFTNVGNSPARRVTMIMGGGSSSGAGASGTPEPGGVSGGSGDFANFAPVAASNVQFLGDMEVGASLSTKVTLIVNATTNPGAYPMKISFTYTTDRNAPFTDDQVVTLLVYSPPLVEVNFYRPVGTVFAGQPTQLPLQIVNLARKMTLLGNMKVTASSGMLENGEILIGPLDTGGYYTLDAMLFPEQPGPLELTVKIDYTDDFNQPQSIVKTLTLEVMESPPMEPGSEGGMMGPDGEMIPPDGGNMPPVEAQPETFGQKVLRFLRGLFGLDSAQPTPAPAEFPGGEMPGEPVPGGKPVIVAPKG